MSLNDKEPGFLLPGTDMIDILHFIELGLLESTLKKMVTQEAAAFALGLTTRQFRFRLNRRRAEFAIVPTLTEEEKQKKAIAEMRKEKRKRGRERPFYRSVLDKPTSGDPPARNDV